MVKGVNIMTEEEKKAIEKLYDLIQANLVEKVGGEDE